RLYCKKFHIILIPLNSGNHPHSVAPEPGCRKFKKWLKSCTHRVYSIKFIYKVNRLLNDPRLSSSSPMLLLFQILHP
ncbi:hypothetical protein C0J52_06043, partial [Blattella germanica]